MIAVANDDSIADDDPVADNDPVAKENAGPVNPLILRDEISSGRRRRNSC